MSVRNSMNSFLDDKPKKKKEAKKIKNKSQELTQEVNISAIRSSVTPSTKKLSISITKTLDDAIRRRMKRAKQEIEANEALTKSEKKMRKSAITFSGTVEDFLREAFNMKTKNQEMMEIFNK